MLAAARQGIDVLGLALRAPAWANGAGGNPFTPPRRPADFAAYLRALVARYGPSGSLWAEHPEVPRHPVRAWEIWNEPNLKDYFTAQPFAKPYAALLRAAYPAVHGADPGATVLMASMANYSWRDLAKLLSAGGPRLRFDAAGAHPFSGRPSNAVKIVRLNRDVLDRRGYAKVPLWLTELTWSSAKGKKKPLTQNWETTEARAGAAAARRLQAAAGAAAVAEARAGLLVRVGDARQRLAELVRLLRPAPIPARRDVPRQARAGRVPGGRAGRRGPLSRLFRPARITRRRRR